MTNHSSSSEILLPYVLFKTLTPKLTHNKEPWTQDIVRNLNSSLLLWVNKTSQS